MSKRGCYFIKILCLLVLCACEEKDEEEDENATSKTEMISDFYPTLGKSTHSDQFSPALFFSQRLSSLCKKKTAEDRIVFGYCDQKIPYSLTMTVETEIIPFPCVRLLRIP